MSASTTEGAGQNKRRIEEPYKESHLRSLLKATSWRVLATLTTTIIAYFITGEVETALTIGGIEFVLKFVIYYLHERAWQLVPAHESPVVLGSFTAGVVLQSLSIFQRFLRELCCLCWSTRVNKSS